jgi:PKD repeat protein
MKKLNLILPRQDSFIYTAGFLFMILLLPSVLAGDATAQPVVKIYPKTIRLEKGKTRTITATAFDQSGNFMPNQIYNYSVFSGSSSSVSISKNVEGNTEDNNSRYSNNLGEITGLATGQIQIVASVNGVQSSPATVTVVDSAVAPFAVIKGDNETETGDTIRVRVGEALEVDAESSEGVNLAEWFWGDGDQTNDLISATHAYLKAGTYQLKLRVTNSSGQSHESSVSVIVSEHPAATRIFQVANLTELLEAYNQCAGGEHIVIPAGTILDGSIELPAREFSDFVTIRSSAKMPDLAVRVKPDQPGLVIFRGTYTNETPVTIKNKANKIRFSGVKFEPFPGTPDFYANYYLLEIGEAFGQKVPEDNPSKIILQHCVVNPPDDVQVVHAVLNDGYKVSILSSWLGNIKTFGSQDSQAVFGLDGRGAHVYNNTYFEAVSESIIYGGSNNRIDGMVPTNIEFRRCFFTKRTSWRTAARNSVGDSINEKNLFETKNARRLYVEGSIFTNHWDALRSQYNAIVLKSSADKPGSGQGVPWAVSEEIVFENNRISHVNGGFSIVRDAPSGSVSFDTLKPQHIKIINVLLDDMTIGRWGEHRTWAFYTNGVDDFQMKNVSIIDSIDTTDELKETAMTLTTVGSLRLEVINSIIPLNYYGIRNSCAEGIGSLNIATSRWFDPVTHSSCDARAGTFGSSWKMVGNVFPLMRSSHHAGAYPANNSYPQNYSEIGMRAYRRCDISWQTDLCESDINDFALNADSAYKNKGIDNTEPGIDTELLTKRLRCTTGGDTRQCIAGGSGTATTPTPTPNPTPTVTPTPTQNPEPAPFPGPAASEIPGVIEAENFDRGGEGIAYHDRLGFTESVVYRNQPPEKVDIQARSDVSGGYVVTEAVAGEWLAYTISVRKTGMYNLEVRYASEMREGTFHIELDEQNITGALTLSPAVNQGTFSNATKKVKLPSGKHTLKLVIDHNTVNPFTRRLSEASAVFDSIIIRYAKSDYESSGGVKEAIFGTVFDKSISNAFIP